MALPQRIVPFYGDEVIAVQQEDLVIFVVFTKLCENLGLNHRPQIIRLQRHEVLSQGLVKLTIDTSGGPQQVQCLKLSLLPLWLAGLQLNRVKEDLHAKLIAYQLEAADVLWQAFKPQIIVEAPAEDLAVSTDAEFAALQQIADMGRAIARMAEEQMDIRRRMDVAARAFQGMRRDITDVKVRLDVLEDRVNPAAHITEAQAAEISNRVKALAEHMTTADTSKNHYQGVFAELYRRFGVSGYKAIPLTQYEVVLAFLENWRRAVVGTNVDER